MAAMYRVKGIGPSERNVVQIILNSQSTASRTVRGHVKHLRSRFDVRGLQVLMEAMRQEKRAELHEQGFVPKETVSVGTTWEELREEGYNEDGGYGSEFSIGSSERDWLLDEVSKREIWIKDADGEPAEIPSAMMAALFDLEEALENAEALD